MNILLLLVLSVIEIVFVFLAVPRKPTVKEWCFTRLIVNGGEVLVFLVMLLFPGIDLGMRFSALFLLLGIRVLLAAILYFFKKRRKEKRNLPVWQFPCWAPSFSLQFRVSLPFSLRIMRDCPPQGSMR